jgi:hypothetical protein
VNPTQNPSNGQTPQPIDPASQPQPAATPVPPPVEPPVAADQTGQVYNPTPQPAVPADNGGTVYPPVQAAQPTVEPAPEIPPPATAGEPAYNPYQPPVAAAAAPTAVVPVAVPASRLNLFKSKRILLGAGIAFGVVVLLLLYTFPLASRMAGVYADKLDKQKLNSQEDVYNKISSLAFVSTPAAKVTKADSVKTELETLKTEQQKLVDERPRLTPMPLAGVLNKKYKKAQEVQRLTSEYDQKNLALADDSAAAVGYVKTLYEIDNQFDSLLKQFTGARTIEAVVSGANAFAQACDDSVKKLESAIPPEDYKELNSQTITYLKDFARVYRELAAASAAGDRTKILSISTEARKLETDYTKTTNDLEPSRVLSDRVEEARTLGNKIRSQVSAL